MKIFAKTNPIVITDEHSTSSPVVVKDGIVYGDSDIVDDTWTGKQAKHDVACREFPDNQEMFDWLLKGTGLETHAEFVVRRAEEHKQSAWMFQAE